MLTWLFCLNVFGATGSLKLYTETDYIQDSRQRTISIGHESTYRSSLFDIRWHTTDKEKESFFGSLAAANKCFDEAFQTEECGSYRAPNNLGDYSITLKNHLQKTQAK